MWDEMSDLDDISVCSCAFAGKLLKREEKQKLVQFLMGLNDSYNAIRGNILMMNPLPTISQIYSMLIQEEKQRQVRGTGHILTESSSLSVDAYTGHQMGNQSFKKPLNKPEGKAEKNEGKVEQFSRRTSLFCDYCMKPGHSIDKCYRLHGFPLNFKFTKGRRLAANVQNHEEDHSTANVTSKRSFHNNNNMILGFSQEQSI